MPPRSIPRKKSDAVPTQLPTKVWVYAGEHYGRVHRLIEVDPFQRVTCIHEPTGYSLTVLRSDVEFCPLTQTEPTPAPGE